MLMLYRTCRAYFMAWYDHVIVIGMLNSNRFDAKVDRSKEDVAEDEW